MNTASTSNIGSDSPSGVGLTFVEMMFAVAVGDTASQIAKVMVVVSMSQESIPLTLQQVLPSITHLALTLLVIATSWVGWSHSGSTRRYMKELRHIFSPRVPMLISFPFTMLLIDVFLVVCYFVLSESAEIPKINAQNVIDFTTSAGPEAVWIAVIMATYLVWNVLIAGHQYLKDGATPFADDRFWRMLAASISCGIACWAYWMKSGVSDGLEVAKIDGALLCAVLFFRLRFVQHARIIGWDVVRGAAIGIFAVALIWCA